MGIEKATNVSDVDDSEEEAGEVVESAPPMKVGESRDIINNGLSKKLLKPGHGWDTPAFSDEVTVHYVGTLIDGTKFDSSRDRGEPSTFQLGSGEVVSGLNHGIVTMKKGETALFTVLPHLGYGVVGSNAVPPNSVIQFEVELISWINVVDISCDGGIIKNILEKGEGEQPGDLDQVLVKYELMLDTGTIVGKSPDEGIEFYVNDGHCCSALPKAIKTMKRGEKVKLIVQPQFAFGELGRDAVDEFPSIPSSSSLSIDLELVSFKPVIDVTGDSKVLKKILKEGEGTLIADEGATVIVRYVGTLEDGTVFEKKGFDGEGSLEFITDEEQVIAGLDRAAVTMKKREQAILTIKPEYGFGSSEVKRDLAMVPPCSTIVYEIEMVDFRKEKTLRDMSNHEKVEAAGKKKDEGNILFKSGKYQRAQKKYNQAAEYIAEDETHGDDEQKLVRALGVSCWLNGAACSLKLCDFHGAIKLCSKVLDIESQNVKALYRRAQAYIETADLFSAELDIKKALEVDPQNNIIWLFCREVKSLQTTLKKFQAESKKRDAKLYSNMFSSLTTKKLKVEDKGDETVLDST